MKYKDTEWHIDRYLMENVVRCYRGGYNTDQIAAEFDVPVSFVNDVVFTILKSSIEKGES